MKITQKEKQYLSLPAGLCLVAILAATTIIPAQASEINTKLLGDAQLDQISAGAATATVHAQAGAIGLHTLAGTGAYTRAYANYCGYAYINIASGAGWAIANGAESGALVDITASVSGNLTASHTASHTAHSPNSGSSYASGYVLQVSYSHVAK